MKPTIPDVYPFVLAYYAKPGNSVGGNLHLVLEDGNVSDRDVAYCREIALERGDADGADLAERLMGMSKTQRRKLYLARKARP